MKKRLALVVSVVSAFVLVFSGPAAAVSRTDPLGDQERKAAWGYSGTALRNMSDLRGFYMWKASNGYLYVRFLVREVAGFSSWRHHDLFSVGSFGPDNIDLQFGVSQNETRWEGWVNAWPAGSLCPTRVVVAPHYSENWVQIGIPVSCLPAGRSYKLVTAHARSYHRNTAGSLTMVGEDETTQGLTVHAR